MDLKPALIKKLDDMQKGLEPSAGDWHALESLKVKAEGEKDPGVIARMVLIVNEAIKNSQEAGKEAPCL